MKLTQPTNSWGSVAKWYDRNLANPNSFQSQVILPNLKRLINVQPRQAMLDLACGQGFFASQLQDIIKIIGIDISPELIKIAKKNCSKSKFFVSPAENINQLSLPQFDKVLTVLALQNIADLTKTFHNVSQVMKRGAKWSIVINHPCFRQPQASSWVYDNENNIQNRVLNKYLSSYTVTMDMNPSSNNPTQTLSYHRPLQEYIQLAKNNNMYLSNMEEWISHIPQDQGPKTPALEIGRQEFPLFMYLEFTKL
jgi:ubiquinone/menaquinone biosynthesis C-methylase UbiE